jgi:hypothetical protein
MDFAAIAVIVGAVLGAVGVLGAGALTGRFGLRTAKQQIHAQAEQQQRQLAHDRTVAWRESRKEAYAEVMTAVDRLRVAASMVSLDPSVAERGSELGRAVLEATEKAILEGSDAVVKAANELAAQATAVSALCMGLPFLSNLTGTNQAVGGWSGTQAEIDALLHKLGDAREQFVQAARADLGSSHPHAE